MFGFSKRYSGIEIGTKALRAVRVRRGKTLVLEGHGEKPLPEGILHPSYTKENISDMKGFREVLQLTLGTAGIMRGDISLSIPDQVVKVSFIDLKGVPPKREEILKFIRWKSKKLLPYDPEAAKIDYNLLGNMAMTVFIKGDVASNYEEALSSLSFRPRFVSTPSLNLFNLFSQRFGDLKDFAFVSVLEDSFSVIIVKDGVIDFHRSKDVGFTDERLMQEITSSVLFYTSEHQDVNLRKVFLHVGMGENDLLSAHLSESTGMDVETLMLAKMMDGPKGLDIEPYAPAVAAALGEI